MKFNLYFYSASILFIFTAAFYASSCRNKNADDLQAQYNMLAFINPSASGYSCPSAPPPFSSLAAAGTTDSCNGCHSGVTIMGSFDITNYNQAKSRTLPGNPLSSLLYQKVSIGTMSSMSNSTINKAIYCWIQGGSNP